MSTPVTEMSSQMIEIKTLPKTTTSGLPTVLTIAGSDSSGGAGIEADIKTISSHGCYGLTCITALTAQNTEGVSSVHTVPQGTIKDILESNLSDIDVDVIKTGMLTSNAINALAECIEDHPEWFKSKPIILDPVMIATTGASLCDDASIKLCVEKLFSKAYLITPNFEEALKILSIVSKDQNEISKFAKIQSIDHLKELTLVLQSILKAKNILIKGGHIPWTEENKPADQFHSDASYLIDVLYEGESESFTLFKSDYIITKDSHGTGCTLASSISSNIAKGLSLKDAVYSSVNYIHCAMSTGLKIGHGNGPLNHSIKPVQIYTGDISSGHIDFKENLVEYFKTHPVVQPNWVKYIQHDFLDYMSTSTLPPNMFTHFLEQDYVYLVNYSRIHALAAAQAPDFDAITKEVAIIDSVAAEMKRHIAKLASYGITDLSSIKPGQACINYCEYLMDIGKREDYLGIKTALAPCLHGYHDAAEYAMTHPDLIKEGVLYEWIMDYTSDWYREANDNGIDELEKLSKGVSQERVNELVKIFNNVTKLEASFWDEVTSLVT